LDDKEGRYYRLTKINVADGSMQLRDEKWASITSSVFMTDGSLVIAAEPVSSDAWGVPSALWSITPDAPPKRITNSATGNYSTLSATRKRDVIVTLLGGLAADIWSMRGGDISSAKEVTSSGQIFPGGGISWTPNGKILFTSTVKGSMDIWMMDADGSNPSPLTSDHGLNLYPSVTPDGRYIVFLNNKQNIFRMDADGKNLKQITNVPVTTWMPRLSPDGKWVYYAEAGTGTNYVSKVSIDGGEPVHLASVPKDRGAYIHDVSPRDGRIVYEYDLFSPKNNVRRQIEILSPGSSLVTPRTLDLPDSSKSNAVRAGLVRWTPDGRYLAFSDTRNNGTWDLIRAMTDKGKILPKPLFTFQGQVGIFEWSRDGTQFGYVRPRRTSDAILITNKGN